MQGQCPVTPVHLVATRTILKRYRRVHSRLATGARLRVSTVCSHRPSGPTSSAARSQFVGSGNTSMERRAAVSEPVSRVDSPSSSSPESPGSPAGPLGEQQSSGYSERAPSLGVARLRSIHASENLPQALSDLLLAAWRQGTARHYGSVWAIWNRWCRGWAIDQFFPRLSDILELLADEFNLDKSYRTVSGYRSALSSVLPPIGGRPIGSHPSVCQLMRGVYKLRPPKPRYSWTWEVGDVLDHLQSWGPFNNLMERRLTLRLTMLLALASARRSVVGRACSHESPVMMRSEARLSFRSGNLRRHSVPVNHFGRFRMQHFPRRQTFVQRTTCGFTRSAPLLGDLTQAALYCYPFDGRMVR